MSIRSNLKVDFSKWAKHPAISQLTQQVSTYEKRISDLVKDFDLKGREARERSRKQLNQVLGQLKHTRAKLEKKVTQLVQVEALRLNKRVTHLMAYVSKVSKQEANQKAASVGRAKRTTKPTRRSTKGTRKPSSKK
jgi:peptidoglycan hydrolase CwlO-like protein